MAKQRQRARRDERPLDPKPIRITERDIQILWAVYQARFLTTAHLQQLFFPSMHQAYARLSALYAHGFLDRLFMGAYTDQYNSPILYVLDRRGADLLVQADYSVQWTSQLKQVGDQFMDHTLAINTVRVAFTLACQQTEGFALVKWLSEADMKSDYDRVKLPTGTGRNTKVSVIPDSYVCLDTPQGLAHFFLELDRGTMTLHRFQQKILAYKAYYQSGAYTERFQTKSLRVLTIATSPTRSHNLMKATQEVGGKRRYWFTHLGIVTATSVLTEAIWLVASKKDLSPLVDNPELPPDE